MNQMTEGNEVLYGRCINCRNLLPACLLKNMEINFKLYCNLSQNDLHAKIFAAETKRETEWGNCVAKNALYTHLVLLNAAKKQAFETDCKAKTMGTFILDKYCMLRSYLEFKSIYALNN